MNGLISGTFTANGDSDEFVANAFTLLLGNETNANYGGGTLKVLVKQDSKNDWTLLQSYTTDQQVKTTIDYAGGLRVKLNLSGSTSPNLPYTIKYQ